MEQPVLELKNVSFAYKGHKQMLKEINMAIQKGKLVAVAGPNGCGKTTLIKHFNGLHKPNFGKIYLKGKEIKNYKELTTHVGLVFQNPDEQVFFPSVEEDIAFGLRNRGYTEDKITEMVNSVLEKLQISKLRNRTFFNLSFGEKKKVAFAGVLVTAPEIMVLDEPTIGLDPWSKDAFIDLILAMKEHSTLIVTTHDLDLLKVVDEIVLMSNGEIVGTYTTYDEFVQNMNKAIP